MQLVLLALATNLISIAGAGQLCPQELMRVSQVASGLPLEGSGMRPVGGTGVQLAPLVLATVLITLAGEAGLLDQ